MELRIDEFQQYLNSIQAPKTSEAYILAAKKFGVFLVEKGWTLEQMPASASQDFVTWMASNSLSVSTIHLYSTGVRQYLKWLETRGIKPTKLIEPKLPRKKEYIVDILESEALTTYISALRTLAEPHSTALILLPLTGLRISEACNLKMAHVFAKQGQGYLLAILNSKGDDRMVPVLPQGSSVLTRYIKYARPALPANEWLFPSVRKPGFPINTRSAQLIIQDLAKKIGASRMTPHTLRHTYATILKRAGMGDLEVARVMGHKNLSTTRKYVHLTTDDIFRDLSKVNTDWLKGI